MRHRSGALGEDQPLPKQVAVNHAAAREREAGRGGTSDIALPDVLGVLRRRWWAVAAAAAGAVVATVAVLWLETPVYAASLAVAPPERDVGTARALVGDFRQQAGFMESGILPIPNEHVTSFEMYLYLLRSPLVAERLDDLVVRRLFPDQWDEARQRWAPPRGLLASTVRAVRAYFGLAWVPPGASEVSDYLQQRVEIVNTNSSVRRITFSHRDPRFAVALLARLHTVADGLARDLALERARARIAGLEKAERRSPEQREVLEQTLVEERAFQAALSAAGPFATMVVSPPARGAEPASQDPLIQLALGAVAGAILGALGVMLYDAVRPAARDGQLRTRAKMTEISN